MKEHKLIPTSVPCTRCGKLVFKRKIERGWMFTCATGCGCTYFETHAGRPQKQKPSKEEKSHGKEKKDNGTK
jgi:predicted  nucleic acid-binding Zn-ribbon protein